MKLILLTIISWAFAGLAVLGAPAETRRVSCHPDAERSEAEGPALALVRATEQQVLRFAQDGRFLRSAMVTCAGRVDSTGPAPESANDAADAAARKFEYLKTNAAKPTPDGRPTIFTEYELNSYLASGKVKLPVGVRSVHFVGTPGLIAGKAEVDFDAITASKRSSNPLLSLFTGVHHIEATAHAEGEAGEAQIHVDAVSLDGVAVPSMAVEFFLERYLKSKHPEAGMNPSFKMSKRIDSALVGEHMLVIIQK